MPFYEYVCDSCGHEFETMQSINAKPLTTCEKCGESIRRVIFPSAIVYKGSGFYSTEYGNSRFNHPTKKKKEPKETTASSSSSSDSSKDSTSPGSDSVKSSSTEKSPKASTSSPTKAAATNS